MDAANWWCVYLVKSNDHLMFLFLTADISYGAFKFVFKRTTQSAVVILVTKNKMPAYYLKRTRTISGDGTKTINSASTIHERAYALLLANVRTLISDKRDVGCRTEWYRYGYRPKQSLITLRCRRAGRLSQFAWPTTVSNPVLYPPIFRSKKIPSNARANYSRPIESRRSDAINGLDEYIRRTVVIFTSALRDFYNQMLSTG